jgi:CTP-dependent riboflavin kinase
VSSRFFRGTYVSGFGHSGRRPRFYESLGLWRGTINIQLPGDTDMRDLIPCERKPGLDPFDSEENENQDFLVRPCKLRGVRGYQLLPINKITGEPRGHHADKVIEISLKEQIELAPGEELEVELEGFG